jgi:hypothetical protein
MRLVQFTVQSGCRVLRRQIAAACERLLGMAHTPDRSPYELGVKV